MGSLLRKREAHDVLTQSGHFRAALNSESNEPAPPLLCLRTLGRWRPRPAPPYSLWSGVLHLLCRGRFVSSASRGKRLVLSLIL